MRKSSSKDKGKGKAQQAPKVAFSVEQAEYLADHFVTREEFDLIVQSFLRHGHNNSGHVDQGKTEPE